MEQHISNTAVQEARCGAPEMFQGYPDVLNLDEMSEILQISTKTGRQLLSSGKIRSFRIGRSYRIPKPYLISFVTGTPFHEVS